jgi:hypothetical protein
MNDFEQIRELGEGQPAPRPDARDAARAALVARFDGRAVAAAKPKAPRRFLRARNLAFVGSLATVAAVLLGVLGTGGGSGVRPEVASAAELNRLAELTPHLGIAGGWQITQTEASAEGGATQLHYERDPVESGRVRIGADAEIRWQTASVEELGRRLEAEGLEAAGTQPTRTSDALAWREMTLDIVKESEESKAPFRHGTAQVYISSSDDQGLLQAVALWRDEGWTFELRAAVESLEMVERLLERLEVLGPEEWLVAVQPGGAEWLRESLNGTVQKLETVRREMPNGTVVMETRATAKTADQLEEFELTAPFPVIHREGDTVRVEVANAPSETSAEG